MLLHRSWTDIQFRSNLFVAAALNEQIQYLVIPWRDFDLAQIKHGVHYSFATLRLPHVNAYSISKVFANYSLKNASLTPYGALVYRSADSEALNRDRHNGNSGPIMVCRMRVKLRFMCAGVNFLGRSRHVRVLLIEDEIRLAENVAGSLRESAGYAVDVSHDGEQGLFLAESNPYDLVLLDLMLPLMSGVEVLKAIRAAGQHSPVLVLTARDEKDSIIDLLNAGADDYLTKPFDLGELLARCKALIRRGKGRSSPLMKIGDLEINTANHLVRRAGDNVPLTAMEYRVLEYLAHRANAVVSKTELLEHLYDYNWEKFSNVIEVYVSGLRRKLNDGSSRQLIQTLRGQGYILQG